MTDDDKQQLENSHDIESLPSYIHGDCCLDPHFLTLNRDIHGNWSIAYVSYGDEPGAFLYSNNSTSLTEAATRMHYAIERWKQRVKTQ